MGIESFYLNITLKNHNQNEIISLCENYKDYVSYYYLNEENQLCLQGSMVSFFPVCEIMYNICSLLNNKFSIENVDSAKNNKNFLFSSSLEFFCWMYDNWREKILYFNKEWGAFIVKPAHYYESRRKLNKKYYRKFNLEN